MKFIAGKTLTYMTAGILAVGMFTGSIHAEAASGWKSQVSLPSAGISYALSAKKVSVRDVKKKVATKNAAVSVAEKADARAQEKQAAAKSTAISVAPFASAANNTSSNNGSGIAEPIPEEPVSAPAAEEVPEEESDIVSWEKVDDSEIVNISVARAVKEVESDESILDTTLTESQEKEHKAVKQAEASVGASSKTATAKEAVVAAVASTQEAPAEEAAVTEVLEEAPVPMAEAPADNAEDEYADLVASIANDFLNVRAEPSTDSEIVGKLYANSVGKIVERTDNGWLKIRSGEVEGYVKEDYVAKGSEAKAIASEVSQKHAVVTTTTLRVRAAATTESDVISLIGEGEELNILEETDGWYKILSPDGEGYISADFADIEEIFPEAVSIEQEKKQSEEAAKAAEEQRKADEAKRAAEAAKREAEKARTEEAKRKAQEAQAAAEAAQKAANDAAVAAAKAEAEGTATPQSQPVSAQGQAVVNYAMQFIGNPYVWGGSSLTNGTDCSGFTMAVYAHFGISLPHYDGSQRSCGTAVNSLAEAQPGDLICYYGHVGIYIGNGQIVHASNPRSGIIVGSATYRQIAAIRRIFN